MQGKGRRAPRISLSDTTPPAPEGYTNVKWQSDALGNRSGYVSGGSDSVSDTAYGASWNGVTTIAPSKNAVYDKIESMSGGGSGNPYNLAVRPEYSDFTWVNQGSATAATTSNGVLYISSAASVGNSLRLLVQNSAGTANTVTVALHALFVILGSTIWETGVVLYDSGSGKSIFFGFLHWSGASPPTQLTVLYFDSVTPASPAAQPLAVTIDTFVGAPLWLRIIDDGSSTRSFQFSADGQVWQTAYSHARTTHFTTPDKVGLCLNNLSGSITQVLHCHSFSKSTP